MTALRNRLACACAVMLLAVTAAGAAPAAPDPAEPGQQNILVLYAYDYGGRGVELFSDGFFKSLTAGGFPVTRVFAEYLDLQRNRELAGYRAEVRDVLRRKYAQRRIDLIITVQQPALEFLLGEGRDIAPQAPVITIQHRPLTDAEKAGRRIVGEVNQFDIRGTLERALELFPRTRLVVFASGSSAADIKLAEEASSVAAAWQGRLAIETTTGMTLDAILQRVAKLPPQSIVIFTQYNVDSQGRVALAYEAEHMIVKAANAPVFGFYDYNLRNGGIGGSVIAVEASGMRTGNLALGILRGERPAQGGTLRVNENIPMFDWAQIQRWGGDVSRLPAHAIFVNRPPGAWQQYRDAIVWTLVFIGAQAALILALVTSIRRRRGVEGKLGQSEARYRRLFHEAPLPLTYVNKHGTLLDRNARFVQTFGYDATDVATLADWWQQAYPDPAYRASVLATWNAAVAESRRSGADIAPVEYRVTCKDGTQRNVVISGITLGEDFFATFFDLTEIRHAEQTLLEAQAAALEEQKRARLAALNRMEDANAARRDAEAAEAEIRRLNADLEQRVVERTAELTAANRELDSFAYAVSHDLRAPLRAMSGFSQALKEDHGGKLDGEASTYLDQIEIAARKMGALIDGLLTLSRSTRGELRHERVDLSALALRRLAELARSDPLRNATWQVEPDLAAQGDASMLEAVMTNLLDNAWKYTAKVAAARIRVYAESRDGLPWICVADNGAGFDMAHAERLFKPFQRLHRQDEFPGIGIGLATVQRILHRHGSSIVATAAPGQGATFCFSLPQGDCMGDPQ